MEPKVTSRMKKGIKLCETILDIKYNGKSFSEAQSFLDNNLPKIKGKDIRDYIPPSQKQLRIISQIKEKLGMTDAILTMKQASDFIGEYLKELRGDSNGFKRRGYKKYTNSNR